MPDARFYTRTGPYPLDELANVTGGRLQGAKCDRMIKDVAPLSQAGPEEISFFDNRLYLDAFKASQAAACIIRPRSEAEAPPGMALLVCDDPYFAYALVAETFYPSPLRQPGIHPRAMIADSAEIAKGCRIDAGAVIADRVRIGPESWIGSQVTIGQSVELGAHCHIHPHVSLQYALIGDRVVIHPGACIGQDGFGFATKEGRHHCVPQLGRVMIGHDVHIGANTTIDRGSGPDTIIGDGCMIDNLVQIGHNVVLGQGCVLVAQSGISGSTELSDYVMIGGQAGLTGHLKIGSGARVAAQSGVMRSVPPGGVVAGSPAMASREWHRQTVLLSRLAKSRTPKDVG